MGVGVGKVWGFDIYLTFFQNLLPENACLVKKWQNVPYGYLI